MRFKFRAQMDTVNAAGVDGTHAILSCRFVFIVAEAFDIDDESGNRCGYNNGVRVLRCKKFIGTVIDDGLLLSTQFSVVNRQPRSFSLRDEL